MLLLALMVPWTAKAQTPTIETIGDGTYETTLVFPGRFNYNYTASLYKPDMADALNSDFNLSSIAYDVVSSGATIDELTIWVKDVDASEYSNTSYISKYNSFSFYIEGATQVYATTTPFNLAEGWNTFNFTTNFSHRAGKALLVAVRGVSNTLSSSPSYRYTYKSYTVWYKRLNSDPGYNYTYGDTDFTFSGDLANIQLGVTYATGIPSDLTVAYPEGIDTEVTLGWTENGEATAWQICLNDDETHLIEANSNPFTLTNLTPETTYTAKVRANHGDTQSDWSTAVSFTPTLKTVLGTATGAVGFLPCNPDYNYSLTQQIYTVAELGNAADLISIDFYNDGNGEATRDLQIYMTHTDQNAFANLYYDWINVASTDLVFSGPVHFVSKGWTSIVLDTPFAYDGQHNVVITVDDNTGSTAGQSIVNFLCYSLPGAGLQSKYFNDDYNHNYDPTNNPGESTYAVNQKNHIRVMKMQPPTDLTVSNVTSQSATLGWTENGTATSWEICIDGDETNLITVTANPYTLTNLTPETTYTAKVRAICAEGHTTWSNEVNFATSATLPYSTDFETDCNWLFHKVGTDEVNAWAWGTATSNGGTHSLYVSNDGGTSYAYNILTTSASLLAYKSFEFEEGMYSISFDWKAIGSWGPYNYPTDNLRVCLTPASNRIDYIYQPGEILLINNRNGQEDWKTESFEFYVSSAQSYRLEFRWNCDVGNWYYNWNGSVFSNSRTPAAIDNVNITQIAGYKPTNLQCTTLSNTATLSWTENNSNPTGWQICLNGDEDHLIDASTNPFTLTGLTFEATYTAKVRTITNFGSTDWSNEISFTPVTSFVPTNLQCTTQDNTATLSWTENNSNATSCQICLNGDESNLIDVTENPYTLTDLTYGATYTAKVRSITNDGASGWSNEVSFTIIALIPYSTNFEDGNDGWTFVKTHMDGYPDDWIDRYNDWAWGSAANFDGSHSIYISDDNGDHFRFKHNSFLGQLYACKYFWFEEGTYHISFDWRCYGMYNNVEQQLTDYLQVSLNSNSGPSMGGLYTSEPLGRNMTWQPMSFDVTVTAAGRYQLVFLYYAQAGWDHNELVGQYALVPAAIDNVSITPVGGLKPTNLQCTAATNTRATLGWTENNSNATAWQICLNGDEDNLISASTNPFTLTDLTTDATYYAKVRSITSDGESFWSDEIGFVPTIKTVLGTGTETSVAVPFANHIATNIQTQQIYTADELGAAGDILSIEFYKTGTATCTRNLNIYMAHTTTNKYTTADDWINTNSAQLIFSGTMNFADDAWTAIPLSTPFHYDGQQNIAITVFDNTESAGETAGFLSYTTPEKQTIVMQSLTAYLFTDKSQIRMLKSDKYTTVDGYGTGDGKWQLVASPIVGILDPMESTNMLSNTYDLYRFNQSAALEWENWKQQGDNYHFNLESGRGYLYANSEDVNLVFSGAPYSGNGQIPLAYDATAHFAGWNLIGNPFATAATIDRPFYRMNEGGTALSAQVETGNTVEAMEGVFVQANAEGQSATFTAATRGNAKAAEVLQISLAKVPEQVPEPVEGREGPTRNSGVSTGSTTATIDNAIIRFDGGQPLGKFTLRTGDSRLYIPQDGKEYAVVTVGDVGRDVARNVSVSRDAKFCVSTEVPVNFKAEENGTYTLSFSAEQVSFSYLHLIDNMTGADVDLLANPTYSFDARTTDYESRFRLVFATGSSVDGDSFGFINGMGNLTIFGIEGEATLQVIDVTGRMLSSETFSGSYEKKLNAAPGVYMLRLINGNDVKVQKIVVR